jgi:hypothetical protein
MGTNPYTHNPCYFSEKAFGTNLFIAPPRYGKSALVKLLMVKIGNQARKPIIIFDYRSEHEETNYPDWTSPDSIGCLPLKKIENFGFLISDFTNPLDWQSLGFPSKTSIHLAKLASFRTSHHDDPETFVEMIKEVPFEQWGLKKFNAKWGCNLVKPMHSEVAKAMQDFGNISDVFISDNNPLRYYGNWKELVRRYRNIHVCLNIYSDDKKKKARALVGKILEQLSDPRFLEIYQPRIFVEEADKLIPSIKLLRDEPFPSSLAWFQEYVTKLQKHHVELFFISQRLDMLNEDIVSSFSTMIIGGKQRHPLLEEFERPISQLRWDSERNYREFIMINSGQQQYQCFVPEQLCCKTVGL